MRKILFAILTVAMLSGCQQKPASSTPTTQPTPPPAPATVHISANTPFVLKAGQTGIFDPNGSTIMFDSLKSDSRCPEGVQCIWEGEATVQLKVKGFSVTSDAETTVTISTQNPKIPLGGDGGIGYSLELVDISPYPKAENPTGSGEYIATFTLIVETSGTQST